MTSEPPAPLLHHAINFLVAARPRSRACAGDINTLKDRNGAEVHRLQLVKDAPAQRSGKQSFSAAVDPKPQHVRAISGHSN